MTCLDLESELSEQFFIEGRSNLLMMGHFNVKIDNRSVGKFVENHELGERDGDRLLFRQEYKLIISNTLFKLPDCIHGVYPQID